MALSRAQQVLERFGVKQPPKAGKPAAARPRRVHEDDDDGAMPPIAGAGSAVGEPAAPGASDVGDPTDTDNQPHDPQVSEWMHENGGQPDGMAGVMDGAADLMDSYMDEADTSTFTPADDDSRQAVSEAKGHMRQAARAMRGIKH